MRTKYPIAEEFHSLQGEGVWTGTAMKFVRLAGCNVGRMLPDDIEPGVQSVRGEHYKAECTLWDGRKFQCDTNYQKHYEKNVNELLQDIWERHLCITGGEPLLHDLTELIIVASMNERIVHIETSGTRYPNWLRKMLDARKTSFWLTVSPKWSPEKENGSGLYMDLVREAHELKLLVDENFVEPNWMIGSKTLVYIQPVNYEKTINTENLARCYKLLETHPNWRISFQAHKLIDWR